MRTPQASRVDMRGFAWKLAALERKLEHDLERARATLASRQREAAAIDALQQALEGERAEQLDWLAEALARGFDAFSHGRSLRFLAQVEARLAGRKEEAQQARSRVDAARQDCTGADRRLASVRKLRETAEAAYATEQLRRDARQADLAWLALSARAPRTARGTGEVAA